MDAVHRLNVSGSCVTQGLSYSRTTERSVSRERLLQGYPYFNIGLLYEGPLETITRCCVRVLEEFCPYLLTFIDTWPCWAVLNQ